MWVSAHNDIKGNDKTNELAKKAAVEGDYYVKRSLIQIWSTFSKTNVLKITTL